MHEDALKLQALWKAEQVRDEVLAEWNGLNDAVRTRQAEESDAATAVEELEARRAALRERERGHNRRIDNFTRVRDRTQQAIDTGAAVDFGIAQHQVDAQAALLDTEETALLELFEEIEEVEKSLAAKRTVLALTRQKLAEATSRRDADKGRIKTAFDQATAARDAAREGIWRELLFRYDQLRSKRIHVIADVVDGACQGCSVKLNALDVAELRRGNALKHCPHCGRFLGEVISSG